MSHGLLSLAIAAIAFCGSHVVLSSTWLRGALRDQLGERGFLAVYSLIALVTFAWLLVAYSHAPTLPLWPRERWMALVPVVVMPLATMLLIAGYTTPNPTTVGMERFARADDPAPGVLRVTRHPVMWAIGLWAVSHVIANGDLRSLLLFGAFAALSLGGTVLIDRKKQTRSRQQLGAARRSHLERALCRAGRRPHPVALARHQPVAGCRRSAALRGPL